MCPAVLWSGAGVSCLCARLAYALDKARVFESTPSFLSSHIVVLI